MWRLSGGKQLKERVHRPLLVVGVILMSSWLTLAPTTTFAKSNPVIQPWYDECVVSASAASTSTVSTDQRLEAILRFFTAERGLSLAAAAGIAGNLKFESGYNPANIEGPGPDAGPDYVPVNGVGIGLAQWTYASRQRPLVDLAKTMGKPVIDMDVQLNYIWQEMTSAKFSFMTTRLGAITSSTTVGSASAPMAAAIIFHGMTNDIRETLPQKEITDVNPGLGYEGSADTAQRVVNNRGKEAESIFNTYKDTISDGTGIVGATESGTDSGATPGSYLAGCSNTQSSAGGGEGAPSGTNRPEQVVDLGKGWTLDSNIDYSGVACATGTTDAGTYTHPKYGFTIRLCQSPLGKVSSLISKKIVDMVTAASQAGTTLTGGSFRSYEEQRDLREAHCPDPVNSPATACTPDTAKAGESQHERGLAVDFNNADRGSATWNWMVAHGAEYGFFNLPTESWHWSQSGY